MTKITFLGTGTPDDFSRAQSCIMIEDTILVDVGNGALLRLGSGNVNKNPGDIKGVLLTHIHLDHCGDLLPLLKARWLSGVKDELTILAPRGTKAWMESVLEAFPFLRNKLKYNITELCDGDCVDLLGFNVKAIKTKHSIESLAYLVDDVLITGDTSPFAELYNNKFNLLVHELSLPSGFSEYHTTPDSLKPYLESIDAEIVYTHMYPHAYSIKDKILEYLGKGFVAKDFDSIEV